MKDFAEFARDNIALVALVALVLFVVLLVLFYCTVKYLVRKRRDRKYPDSVRQED